MNAITNHTVHTHLSKQDFRMLCRTFAHQVSCQPLETRCYLANIVWNSKLKPITAIWQEHDDSPVVFMGIHSIFRSSSKTSTSISSIRSGPPEPFSTINFNGGMKSPKGLDLTASWIQTWRMNQTWSKYLSDVWLALLCTSSKHES